MPRPTVQCALSVLFPLTLAATLLGAHDAAAAGEPPLDAGPPLERLIERYQADRDDIDRFHRAPLSREHHERMVRFTDEWRARLDQVKFDALPRDARIDWLLLDNELDGAADALAFDAARDDDTRTLLPFADDVLAFEEARRRMEGVGAEDAASRLVAIEKAVTEVQRRVEHSVGGKAADDALPCTPVVAYRAAREADALLRTLATWFDDRNGYEPGFSWWTHKPYESLRGTLEGYAKYLREKVAGVTDRSTAPLLGDPIGADALDKVLRHEMIAYSPAELLSIARAQFAWCEAQAKAAEAELGVADWKAAVELVKSKHVAPGEQDELVAATAKEAIAFVEEHDLVNVPDTCKELWRLSMISAQGQKTLPFAAYSGNAMLVAYPTDAMTHDEKLMSMRGNNTHFTHIVTPHELIPGHHLQLFWADRVRPYRRLFRTPFLVEGWALYWEMLLWDQGWARNAEDRVGMLFWRMHRAARVIVTLEFHLGNMKPAAMVDFLVDRVGLERDGATSEVRRYIAGDYGPLYQCAYLIGGLQLRALRHELVESGKLTDRAFHDAVLSQNSIPVEMVRLALTDAPVTKDHTPAWRFAGEPSVDDGK